MKKDYFSQLFDELSKIQQFLEPKYGGIFAVKHSEDIMYLALLRIGYDIPKNKDVYIRTNGVEISKILEISIKRARKFINFCISTGLLELIEKPDYKAKYLLKSEAKSAKR